MKDAWERAFGIGILTMLCAFCSVGAGRADKNYVYVVNYHSRSISGFVINAATGALTPLADSPFAAGNCPSFIAIDPSDKFAYLIHKSTDFFSDNISGFSMNAATGALTPLAGPPLTSGNSPSSIAFDPMGKSAYVANGTADNVSAFSINTATGALTEVAGSPYAAGIRPKAIAVDPSGKFAYVTNVGSDNISAFSINTATGMLTKIAGSPFAAYSPEAIAIDYSGKFALVVSYFNNNVSVFSINNGTGALTPIAAPPFAVGISPVSIAVVRIAQ